MNIFFIEHTTKNIAQSYADQHVNVGIKEKAQMLSEAYRTQNIHSEDIYGKFNPNHPMSKWVRESKENFKFTIELTKELNKEFKKRGFKDGKTDHGSMAVVKAVEDMEDLLEFEKTDRTTPPYCFNDRKVEGETEIEKWRNFYKIDKIGRVDWSRKPERKPEWFNIQQ